MSKAKDQKTKTKAFKSVRTIKVGKKTFIPLPAGLGRCKELFVGEIDGVFQVAKKKPQFAISALLGFENFGQQQDA